MNPTAPRSSALSTVSRSYWSERTTTAAAGRCSSNLLSTEKPSRSGKLSLPDRDGFSVLSKLLEHRPAAAVVVLSDQYDRETVLRALDLGAVGFIAKSEQRQTLLSALQLVFAGGIHVPRE